MVTIANKSSNEADETKDNSQKHCGHKRWSYKIGIQGEKHKECKQADNQADDHEKEEASKYI